MIHPYEIPMAGKDLEDQPDALLFRICLWAEARGEGAIGILAVAHVILNRMKLHGLPARDVILKPSQFSSFNANDPNRAKLLTAHEREPVAWGQCDAIARLALLDLTEDPTTGATHYLTRALYKSAPPSWAKPDHGWKELTTIGSHVFGVSA